MARFVAAVFMLLAAPVLSLAQAAGASPPAQSPAAQASPDPQQQGRLATVRLKSGQVLTGRIVSRDDRELVLESQDGVRSVIPAGSVAEVREAAADAKRAPWELDPNRTRYLYTPSGFMLSQGEGYVSQTELLLTTVAYGVTDWLTVGVGGVVPAWFASDGFNLIGLVKVGASVTSWLHVAGTTQVFWAPSLDDATVAGLAFGTVTLGSPDLHLGVSAGAPFVAGDIENDVGEAAFSLSGTWRVSNRIALVTENWFFPNQDSNVVIDGLAVRFIGSRLGVDAGLIFATDLDIPIPWLDFTWHF
jgi:hypothetical protein